MIEKNMTKYTLFHKDDYRERNWKKVAVYDSKQAAKDAMTEAVRTAAYSQIDRPFFKLTEAEKRELRSMDWYDFCQYCDRFCVWPKRGEDFRSASLEIENVDDSSGTEYDGFVWHDYWEIRETEVPNPDYSQTCVDILSLGDEDETGFHRLTDAFLEAAHEQRTLRKDVMANGFAYVAKHYGDDHNAMMAVNDILYAVCGCSLETLMKRAKQQ